MSLRRASGYTQRLEWWKKNPGHLECKSWDHDQIIVEKCFTIGETPDFQMFLQ